jgi:hypothetical protein
MSGLRRAGRGGVTVNVLVIAGRAAGARVEPPARARAVREGRR